MMKVDGGLSATDVQGIARQARELEDVGYRGLITAETSHDPFLPLGVAAEHTTEVDLLTGIAVAFPRSPMHLANLGHDLHQWSGGRFILGLGSQIKTHIEKRFSSPWGQPAARMRELITAVRAVWDCWETDGRLDFRGDFYTHTLMTPFFNPGPTGFGTPDIYLAAVGERMTEVAGEVADGLLVHGFTTERYLRERTVPAVMKGLERSGRTRQDFTFACPVFIVTGNDEREFERAGNGVRQQIAFYGSTPAYRGVLELHGWGDLQTELNVLSKKGRWEEMGRLITDDVLDAFAVRGVPEDIPTLVLDRFGDVLDRITFYAPYRSDPARWSGILAGFGGQS